MAGGGDADLVVNQSGLGCEVGVFDKDYIDLIITDPIHGPMEFHPLLVAIIDTPHFQRLRDIKQLGGSMYVYPAADHCRFVHSLGVAHLARKVVEQICKRASYSKVVSHVDMLCVSIAGLIHDLGHGPYSHLWENFMNMQRPQDNWAHEDQSFRMFEALIEENNLRPLFEEEGFTERDFQFIKELIHPPKPKGDEYPFKGRDPGKEFLYQIVSNPFSGVDVDKMDYIARDSKALGVDVTFDFRRYLLLVRILQMDDEFWTIQTSQGPVKRKKFFIGIRDKMAMNMVSMFSTRQSLHRKAYQHKTTKIVEKVLLKIFAAVDDEEIFPVYSPELDRDLRLSLAYQQTDAFITLTNDILNHIWTTRPAKGLSSEKREKLESARQMITDLKRRKFPKLAHALNFNPTLNQEWLKPDEVKWRNDLIRHHDAVDGVEIRHCDVEFVVINFDYGQKGNDPIAQMPFYRKNGTIMRTSMREISHTLPGEFNIAEQKIFVYSNDEEKRDAVGLAARKWEDAKKIDWWTPKRLRGAAGTLVDTAEATKTTSNVQVILSPASSMGEVEEDEEPQRLTQTPFDTPSDTPPLSQQALRSRPMERSLDDVAVEDNDGFGAGVKRNLFSAFEDAPSPNPTHQLGS